MQSVRLSKIIDKMELKNLTPQIDVIQNKVTSTDINKPALQLKGFFYHYTKE